MPNPTLSVQRDPGAAVSVYPLRKDAAWEAVSAALAGGMCCWQSAAAAVTAAVVVLCPLLVLILLRYSAGEVCIMQSCGAPRARKRGTPLVASL